jgi:hypothetical protein
MLQTNWVDLLTWPKKYAWAYAFYGVGFCPSCNVYDYKSERVTVSCLNGLNFASFLGLNIHILVSIIRVVFDMSAQEGGGGFELVISVSLDVIPAD